MKHDLVVIVFHDLILWYAPCGAMNGVTVSFGNCICAIFGNSNIALQMGCSFPSYQKVLLRDPGKAKMKFTKSKFIGGSNVKDMLCATQL